MSDTKIKYRSGKTYTHAHGFSCAFRQWRADSHCHFLHGYSLQIELVWEGDLNQNNWVMDFGGLKNVKAWLENTFDHKTIVAEDDPEYNNFTLFANLGIIDLVVVPAVGAEKFAELIFRTVDDMFIRSPSQPNWPLLHSVTVREHAGNHATVIRDEP